MKALTSINQMYAILPSSFKLHTTGINRIRQCQSDSIYQCVSPGFSLGVSAYVSAVSTNIGVSGLALYHCACYCPGNWVPKYILLQNHVEPEGSCQSEEPIAMDTHNEYTPDQPDIPNLDLDIADGLSDYAESDLSGDAEIVKLSNLQWFASALQEAQHCAIQLERERGKEQKKTYQGNLRPTHYHFEKACKELASQGVLDFASFMALKRETAVSGPREDIGRFGLTTRGCADCAQYDGDTFGAENACKGPHIDPIPPLDWPLSKWSEGVKKCTSGHTNCA